MAIRLRLEIIYLFCSESTENLTFPSRDEKSKNNIYYFYKSIINFMML